MMTDARAVWSSVPGPINFYCTLVDLPPPPWPARSMRSRNDPAMAQHLDGLCGWIMAQSDGGAPTPAQAHAVEHVWRVQHQIALDSRASSDAEIGAYAAATNALVFLADGTLRDPSGAVVVGPGTTRGDAPYPARGHERRARSRALLSSWGFDTPEHLPPSPCELEVVARPVAEVWARARGVSKVAMYSEGLRMGERMGADQLDRGFGAEGSTPQEAAYIRANNVDSPTIARFGFRYESAFALHWALGLVPELPFPDTFCDAATVVRSALKPPATPTSLRPLGELLDVLDLHYRLHWWADDRRLRGEGGGGFHGGIVQERRIALQWIIGLGGFDWESMPTPT